MININENIRYLRKKKGWTQDKFSKIIGIKRSLIGAYEEGRAYPRLNNLLKITDVFGISLDNILTKDVKKIPEDCLKSSNDEKVKVLSITVDDNGNENIELINQKASAGYLNSYSDFEYIEKLPKFQLPFLKISGTYRAFEINGDSMLPLKSGSIVIGKYVDSLSSIKSNHTYVLLTESEGITYKRVSLEEGGNIKLMSDNIIYKPYYLSFNEIIELWQAIAFFSYDLPKPNDEINRLQNVVQSIQSDINNIKNKIN